MRKDNESISVSKTHIEKNEKREDERQEKKFFKEENKYVNEENMN